MHTGLETSVMRSARVSKRLIAEVGRLRAFPKIEAKVMPIRMPVKRPGPLATALTWYKSGRTLYAECTWGRGLQTDFSERGAR